MPINGKLRHSLHNRTPFRLVRVVRGCFVLWFSTDFAGVQSVAEASLNSCDKLERPAGAAGVVVAAYRGEGIFVDLLLEPSAQSLITPGGGNWLDNTTSIGKLQRSCCACGLSSDIL